MGCAVPAAVSSNILVVQTNVGVMETTPSLNDITIFPNPNSGSFTIKGMVGSVSMNTIHVEIVNTLGQVIYTSEAPVTNNAIDNSVNMQHIPNGVYMLRLSSEGEAKTFRFSVSR